MRFSYVEDPVLRVPVVVGCHVRSSPETLPGACLDNAEGYSLLVPLFLKEPGT
jgi:hypothetical protein